MDVSLYSPPFGWKNQYDVFVKVLHDGISCFHLLRSYILFYATTVSRNEPQSTQTMQFTRISYVHVLWLELAALAIIVGAKIVIILNFTKFDLYMYESISHYRL